jgi:hypothetical protein
LSNQTLSCKQWEFLLVDNASDQMLAAEIDLSWHPQAGYIRENQLEFTLARLSGFILTIKFK